ncbi:MAG: DNA primase [Hyphomicrobiales bacterium]|nr:DNA primase [Hyphomicrobiales bacterium]
MPAATSRFPAAFIEEVRARANLYEVAGRYVQWHAGKSNPSRRDWWACCPFHHEKTPSFHVDEAKGFYYCFGCQAKGDAVSFVMEVERLSYPEAIKSLASRFGIPLPEITPEVIEREEQEQKQREKIRKTLEAAQDFFVRQLRKQSGESAQEHLLGRGINRELWELFGLGFAPPANKLTPHLAEKGFSQKHMIDAGLVALGEGDKKPYERFRNRIIFPIHDTRGGLIAFGGRALTADAPAKYLNSPETLLFQKRNNLYNLARARKPSQQAQSIILVEGYMDVIAMTAAGFSHTIAPLGTALGAEQIELLWRLAPEPVVCFDGDNAGIRAAERAAQLVLERLKPGHSMRFALLPKEQDPEDILRQSGTEAMNRLLQGACPLDELLWQQELSRSDWHTPERRARLEQSIQRLVARIQDHKVRAFYQSAMRTRVRNLFFGSKKEASASLSARRNTLAGASEQTRRRVRLLLYLGVRFPELIERYGEELSALDISDPEADAVRDTLLEAVASEDAADSEMLLSRLKEKSLGGLVDEFQRRDWSSPMVAEGVHRDDFTLEQGDELWRHVYALEQKAQTRRKDIPDAASELASLCGDKDKQGGEETPEIESLYQRLRDLHDGLAKPQGSETRFESEKTHPNP